MCKSEYILFGWECMETNESIAQHALRGDCSRCRPKPPELSLGPLAETVYEVARDKAEIGFIRLPGIFKDFSGELRGRDWVSKLGPHDRALFSGIGRAWSLNGKSGGMVRALTGLRDERGRFCRATSRR